MSARNRGTLRQGRLAAEAFGEQLMPSWPTLASSSLPSLRIFEVQQQHRRALTFGELRHSNDMVVAVEELPRYSSESGTR